jgi:short-subunit dehydrogenase
VWINNVGVGAVGRYDLVPLESHRRVIESNLLGHMHGSHVALTHFRRRRRGTLINMISIGGWLSAPYAAAYTASKFALKGFGQSLRAELSDMPHIHVCDVFPAFVDTPGVRHGANYTRRSLRPLPPLLHPETVAERIADLLRHPRPVVTIGSAAWIGRAVRNIAPEIRGRVTHRFLDFALARGQHSPETDGNLFEPSRGHAVLGGFRRPATGTMLLVAGAAASLAAISWMRSSDRS